jgi:hypothetical protein
MEDKKVKNNDRKSAMIVQLDAKRLRNGLCRIFYWVLSFVEIALWG